MDEGMIRGLQPPLPPLQLARLIRLLASHHQHPMGHNSASTDSADTDSLSSNSLGPPSPVGSQTSAASSAAWGHSGNLRLSSQSPLASPRTLLRLQAAWPTDGRSIAPADDLCGNCPSPASVHTCPSPRSIAASAQSDGEQLTEGFCSLCGDDVGPSAPTPDGLHAPLLSFVTWAAVAGGGGMVEDPKGTTGVTPAAGAPLQLSSQPAAWTSPPPLPAVPEPTTATRIVRRPVADFPMVLPSRQYKIADHGLPVPRGACAPRDIALASGAAASAVAGIMVMGNGSMARTGH